MLSSYDLATARSSSVLSSSGRSRQSGRGMSSKISSSSDLTSSMPSIMVISPRLATESALAAASRASASILSLARRSRSSGDTHLATEMSASVTWSTRSGSSSGCSAGCSTSLGSSMPSRRSSAKISATRTCFSRMASIEPVLSAKAAWNLALKACLSDRTRSAINWICAARRQWVVTSNMGYSSRPGCVSACSSPGLPAAAPAATSFFCFCFGSAPLASAASAAGAAAAGALAASGAAMLAAKPRGSSKAAGPRSPASWADTSSSTDRKSLACASARACSGLGRGSA
mmetsp:Transcript_37840/g.120332  ORF Transcript_37840/g.120332 Transcript_37840/m.120332 type:complete len:288 (-) Transcript_37840:355-1218(-)